MIEIRNRWDGGLLYKSEAATTIKAVLTDAVKARAVLRSADLSGADLSGAVLSGADLRSAVLRSAVLSGADLRSAVLRSADLRSAVLSGADLRSADLRSADLSGADLRSADLSGADLSGAVLPSFWLLPEEGSFVGFKKLSDGAVARLEILDNARRVCSLVGRKCRAEAVRTLAIQMPDGTEVERAESCGYNRRALYVVGEITRPDSFNDDIRIECSNGIHFFITMKEAQEYNA